ncbi:hypothetical protein PLESTB_001850200 [Pleodorina starrii]|uniref:Uncharacterized protein n=1 Tax=Pleodorina starrii TaxID=330485 RepID=A0A9W6FAU7_9CHLO|nr:hypothetical protein PLESTB_001850200 [Pleodorina starrii]
MSGAIAGIDQAACWTIKGKDLGVARSMPCWAASSATGSASIPGSAATVRADTTARIWRARIVARPGASPPSRWNGHRGDASSSNSHAKGPGLGIRGERGKDKVRQMAAARAPPGANPVWRHADASFAEW